MRKTRLVIALAASGAIEAPKRRTAAYVDDMHTLVSALKSFADYQACLVPVGHDRIALAGIAPWDDSMGKTPAFVVVMTIDSLLAQDGNRQPMVADSDEAIEPFQLLSVSSKDRILFVGQGHFGYSLELRRNTAAELLRFQVDPDLYKRFYEGGLLEEKRVFRELLERFFASDPSLFEKLNVA